MVVSAVFKSNFRVTNKETALEFYKCLKSVVLIPYSKEEVIRVEPNNSISVIPKKSVTDGSAPFIPSFRDEDGSIAYRYRKYLNAYITQD